MDVALRAVIADALGAELESARALGGGSINAAWSVVLADGRELFVKSNAEAPPDMFALEARGLELLRDGIVDAEDLSVPALIHVGPRVLVLELLDAGPPCADFDERLGRGLAALHRSGARLGARQGGFGLDHDNYIGSEPQPNAIVATWSEFYRRRRLTPMLERAAARGLVSPELRARFERLFEVLDERCGEPEPPARLHGDLWAGNLHRDARGRPVLIDPAVYLGHREVDLAMMRLFGGFSPRCFAAYHECAPLAPGWERRVDLYQLYPLLVHVVLFGAGYLSGVESALRRLL